MRNHIPKLKTLKYTKTREEQEEEDYTGKLILIESDNPNFSHEVYDFKSRVFRGYTGNKNFKKKIESKNEERKEE
jgi:hypothetical protein